MANILYIFILTLTVVSGQENAMRNLSPSLRECYENKYLLERDNRLPHTFETFIAILRKIENAEGFNMDLRGLSVALLHRFRQDGITKDPNIPIQDGITPYAPNTFSFFRFAETLHLIPGNAMTFPNDSITNVERCTLHFMLSSSIEVFNRGDETKVCRFANAYRYSREIKDHKKPNSQSGIGDVETLSSDEIKSITHHGKKNTHDTVDPNWFYPELPPNHPDFARYAEMPPRSKCPVENGVIKTRWGAISPGLVLAAIAAATQPETTMLSDLQPDIMQNNTQLKGMSLDNKWLATLAGDLAEVALIQGPTGNPLSVGVTGNWNSSAMPRWYFLSSNDKFEMTTSEIRGDLDGLILANEINKWYSRISSLRLSQIFDMYYSNLGFFDQSIRACNRRNLFTSVAPNETMVAQTHSVAIALNDYISRGTLQPAVIEKFSVQAINELIKYVPTAMNSDLGCNKDKMDDLKPISVDLTIILDTNWDFLTIKPVLAYLLENIDLNRYNSNFTLINGNDGTTMINSTYSILDFHNYNSSHYQNVTHGFNLAKSFKELELQLSDKLNDERSDHIGGARSNVVLIIPYTSDLSENDKEYCLQSISKLRVEVPDTTLLIMTHRSKDTWSNLVKDPVTDLFSINVADTDEALTPIINVVSRIKEIPKRLINTQCGADYISVGTSNDYVDYIIPHATNLYKLHPNYFFRAENTATIKVQGSTGDSLTVCSSQQTLHQNASESSKSCASITNDVHTITVTCGDAAFIHECPPLYISVSSNSSINSYQCTDRQTCRYPNMIKYTISYENLSCTSGAMKSLINAITLIVLLTCINLQHLLN